uniref:Secreted protein n=1 Tax=Octopus bimaculoides TaxID=37653 RepID=A0A0L8IB76_OCTBM
MCAATLLSTTSLYTAVAAVRVSAASSQFLPCSRRKHINLTEQLNNAYSLAFCPAANLSLQSKAISSPDQHTKKKKIISNIFIINHLFQ